MTTGESAARILRRAFGVALALASACSAAPASSAATAPAHHPAHVRQVAPAATRPVDDAATQEMLDDIEHRTFNYFWETTNPANGQVPDRWPTPAFASIAAIGFALTAYPIGVERHYITRAQAVDRVRHTLQFLQQAPQGPNPDGEAGFHGLFYHFLDMETGARYRDVELSSIDTTLLMMGVLFSEQYFNGTDPAETEIRQLADQLYRAVEWGWMSNPDGAVSMGWKPETGLFRAEWIAYNEALMLYILGLGSPTHPLPLKAWKAWTATYALNWRTEYGQTYLAYPTLFVHQFTPVWVDLKGPRDAFMRAHKLDYFENTRRATYANRAYGIANPMHWNGYGADLWGFTACDGPGNSYRLFQGELREFFSYAARGIALYDDGTIAPNGPIGSLPFAPEIALPAIRQMRDRYGDHLYGQYGFVDSFNPSFDGRPATGGVVPQLGWFAPDYLGIDEGLIISMIENYRTGLIWRYMRNNPYIRQGMKRAGFTGGWLAHR